MLLILNYTCQAAMICISALSFTILSFVSIQEQRSSASSSTTQQSTPRPKKKLPQGSRGFELYAGRDASDKLITGAATRSPLSAAAQSFDQGMKSYTGGRLEEAAAAFKKAVQLAPEWADAHYSLAIVYGELEQYKEAVDEFKRANALKINDDLRALATYNMGNAYADLGEYENAATAYKQVMMLKPELPQPHYNLALSYVASGQTIKAVEEFKEAARLNPDYAEAHYNLGVAYIELGDKSKAVEQQQVLKTLKSELESKLAALIK